MNGTPYYTYLYSTSSYFVKEKITDRDEHALKERVLRIPSLYIY